MLVSIVGNQTDFNPAIVAQPRVHPEGDVGGQVYHLAGAVHRELKRFMPGSQRTKQIKSRLA